MQLPRTKNFSHFKLPYLFSATKCLICLSLLIELSYFKVRSSVVTPINMAECLFYLPLGYFTELVTKEKNTCCAYITHINVPQTVMSILTCFPKSYQKRMVPCFSAIFMKDVHLECHETHCATYLFNVSVFRLGWYTLIFDCFKTEVLNY
jgi:hypothetical protein